MVLALGLIAVFAAAACFLFAFEGLDVRLAGMFILTPFAILSVDIGISFNAYEILGIVLWGALFARPFSPAVQERADAFSSAVLATRASWY